MLTVKSKCLVVFSKSYCPYCKASKTLLNELNAKYTTIELDQIGLSLFSSFFTPGCFLSFFLSFFLLNHVWLNDRKMDDIAISWLLYNNYHLSNYDLKTKANWINNRWRPRHPRRPPGDQRPAHRPQHLHPAEAHRGELGSAGEEGWFACFVEGCWGCLILSIYLPFHLSIYLSF